MFNEIIERLVTGEILKYLLEQMTKSKWNMMEVHEKSAKYVLNLSHLDFGFQICFFVLFAALLTFLLEFFDYWIKHRYRVVKDAGQFTILIRIGMKDVF